jgi:stearoyl-CoA desaturase (delta-9 desaturase)
MHRYAIHRQFYLNPKVEYSMKILYWLLFGVVSKEFIVQHRKHHEYSDTWTDPHTPKFGFWKLLLICLIPSFFCPYKITVSSQDYERYGVYNYNTFVDRFPRLGVLVFLIISLLLFGWYGIVTWTVHLFVVNFLTITTITVFGHSFGYRNFNLNDYTKNIVPIGIVCVGEEMHNNHHMNSKRCNFAVNKNEFDLGFYYLKILNKFKLVEFKNGEIK